ncbi:MAG: hypothetical protein V3R13_03585 [Nitrososphaerales archaeon]
MKRTIWALLLALLLIPNLWVANPANAQQEFEEHLSITVVGRTALWEIALNGVNVSSAVPISNAEGISGVDRFSFITARQSGFTPEAEFFKSNGYNLLPTLLPDNGIFLEVEAESLDSAMRFANEMNNVFHVGFILYSANDPVFLFHSFVDFNRIVVESLWEIFTEDLDGFDQFLIRDAFISNSFPVFRLVGIDGGSGFDYSVTLFGLSFNPIAQISLDLGAVFPSAISFNASSKSVNSTIRITTYGSFLEQVTNASISYDPDRMQSSRLIEIQAGKQISSTFFSLIFSPPVLSVTRDVDRGVASVDETIEARLEFENRAPLGGITIDQIIFEETWWTTHLDLVESSGDDNVTSLAPGESVTIVKVFEVMTNDSVLISPSREENTFSYTFSIGNDTFTSFAVANGIRIVLNDLKSSIVGKASSDKSFIPLGGTMNTTLTLKNVGARTAFSLDIFLNDEMVQSLPALAPNPLRTIEISTNITSSNLRIMQNRYTWRIDWEELGEMSSISSNVLTIIDNYSRPDVPNLTIEKGATQNGSLVEITLLLSNDGGHELLDIFVIDQLPPGSQYEGGNLTEGPDRLTALIPTLSPGNSTLLSYRSTLGQNENLVAPPSLARFTLNDRPFEVISNSIVEPLSVSIVKEINTNLALLAYNFTVNLSLENRGRETLYDVNILGLDSAFLVNDVADRLRQSELAPGDTIEFSYLVRSFRETNISLTEARVEFVMGGKLHTITSDTLPFQVVDSPSVEIRSEPDRSVENRPFELILEISNPSELTLRSIIVKGDEIANLRVISGSLSEEFSELAPGQTVTLRATVSGPIPGKDLVYSPQISHVFLGQRIEVPVQPFDSFVEEDLITRFAPTLALAAIVILATLILARRGVRRKAKDEPSPS